MEWDLSKKPTRLLLKWLSKARKCGHGYDPTDTGNCVISIEKLKTELATREHIPNKLEGKRIRREKASR